MRYCAIMELTGPPAPLMQQCMMCPMGGRLFIRGGAELDVKLPTTFGEQMRLLQSRNCIITDESACIEALSKINYYRFSAYLIPFKEPDGSYRDGTTFARVYRRYEFDRKMRLILMEALEEIEVFVGTQIAYFHAHKYGALGYLESSNFNEKHHHEKTMAEINRVVEQNRTSSFVKHHIEKYNSKFPVWVIFELFSWGMLSHFYADLPGADRKHLAKTMYSTSEQILKSWLRCGTDLRNICAHYGRLYSRRLSATPATPKGSAFRLGENLYSYIVMLKMLYPDGGRWKSTIMSSIYAIIEEYGSDIQLSHIGFPQDWETSLRN
jgi:Abortive infection bacteriophage resistance protein